MDKLVRVLGECAPRSMAGIDKSFRLYTLLKAVASLPGHIAELGVYKGGTARLIARVVDPKKEIHLFDTFEGMPDPRRGCDKIGKGCFNDTSAEEVAEFLKVFKNVRIHKGLFPATAEVVKDRLFCFVHADGDFYESTIECLRFFHPRLTPGGVVVVDDYDYVDCPGVRKAIEEFLLGKPDFHLRLSENQYLIIKA